MEDHVTVSEAARRLNCNKSNVSRQVRKLDIPRDAKGQFSFAAYEEARARDLNPLMARAPAPGARRESAVEPSFHVPESGAADDGRPKRPPLMAAHTAHKALQARLLELQIAEKEGKLVERAEVSASVMTASRMLRDALLGLPARMAGEIAGLSDVGEIKATLDRRIRDELAALDATLRALTEDDLTSPAEAGFAKAGARASLDLPARSASAEAGTRTSDGAA